MRNLKSPKALDTLPSEDLTVTVLPIVRRFHGLVVTSRVDMHGIRQAADQLIVFDVLLLDERLGAFKELSLVPMIAAVTPIHVLGDVSYRHVSLPRKRVATIVWARRCTRVRRVDRDNALSWNLLQRDHRVRTTTQFLRERGRLGPRSWVE